MGLINQSDFTVYFRNTDDAHENIGHFMFYKTKNPIVDDLFVFEENDSIKEITFYKNPNPNRIKDIGFPLTIYYDEGELTIKEFENKEKKRINYISDNGIYLFRFGRYDSIDSKLSGKQRGKVSNSKNKTIETNNSSKIEVTHVKSLDEKIQDLISEYNFKENQLKSKLISPVYFDSFNLNSYSEVNDCINFKKFIKNKIKTGKDIVQSQIKKLEIIKLSYNSKIDSLLKKPNDITESHKILLGEYFEKIKNLVGKGKENKVFNKFKFIIEQ